MKKNKLFSFIPPFLVLIYLIPIIFGWGIKKTIAAENCGYRVDQFKTASTGSRSIVPIFTVQVTRGTTGGVNCSDSVTVKYELDLANHGLAEDYVDGFVYEMGSKNYAFNGNSFTASDFSYNFANLPWDRIQNPNKLMFYAWIFVNGDAVTASGAWPVTISGTTGGSGDSSVLSLNISFTPAKGTFNAGESLRVNVGAGDNYDKFELKSDIYTYVNSNWNKPFINSNVDRTNMQYAYQDIAISPENSFTNGTNSIYVKVVDAGTTNVKRAEGTAQVNVQGLPETPTGSNLCQNGICSSGPKAGASCTVATAAADCGTTPTTPTTPSGSDAGGSLINPLPKETLTDMLIFIMQGFLGIIGIWAVIFIIYGGFEMVMAQGNEESYTKAKKTITWAILGLVIAVLSFSIIAIVQNLLGVKVQ